MPERKTVGLTRREILAGAVALPLAPTIGASVAAGRRRSRSRVHLLPDARTVEARGLAPADLGLLEAAALLQARRLSSVELTTACLARAERDSAGLRAWIRIYREPALAQARLADARLSLRMVRRTSRRAPLVRCPTGHEGHLRGGGAAADRRLADPGGQRRNPGQRGLGPMARSAADAALLLSYMTVDGRYLHRPSGGTRPLTGLRVGVPSGSFGGVAIDPGIAARTESYGRELASLGAQLVGFAAPRSSADNLSSHAGIRTFLTLPGSNVAAGCEASRGRRAEVAHRG